MVQHADESFKIPNVPGSAHSQLHPNIRQRLYNYRKRRLSHMANPQQFIRTLLNKITDPLNPVCPKAVVRANREFQMLDTHRHQISPEDRAPLASIVTI